MQQLRFTPSALPFADPSFRVGVVIDIKLDIRPRKTSGVLMSVHGRRDFLLLQMVNGVLKFSVDNGKGAISAQYTPPHEHYFCDGHWHTIQGTSRNWVLRSLSYLTLTYSGIVTSSYCSIVRNFLPPAF
jgi:laminin alpha 3/5